MGIPGESISLALALVLDFGISLGESFLEFSLLLVLLMVRLAFMSWLLLLPLLFLSMLCLMIYSKKAKVRLCN